MSAQTILLSPKASGGDDRLMVRPLSGGALLLALADGATGMGHGALAAEAFLRACERITGLDAPDDLIQSIFLSADNAISRLPESCDTTGILCLVRDRDFVLASVGDSVAWSFANGALLELTAGQRRKPRIGSGCARPAVHRGQRTGDLILASDGLLHALPQPLILAALANRPKNPARALAEAAQAANPERLPDDLSVITCPLAISQGNYPL